MSDWEQFTHGVRERTGIRLGGYKPAQTQRRVRGLMQRCGARDLGEYLSLLDREPARLHELRRSVSVQVSEFFRSPEQFRLLAERVLPALLAAQPALRIWSAGCSYGAEPFSVALLLQQLAPQASHYLLATDIDELALARAMAADSFTERDLLNVPPELRAYFDRAATAERFALAPAISSRVTFRRHDLLTDPIPDPLSPAPFDLITCRNVMMYFAADAKAGLLEALHGSLRPGGYLFVGDAEVVNELPAGWDREAVGFYRKVGR